MPKARLTMEYFVSSAITYVALYMLSEALKKAKFLVNQLQSLLKTIHNYLLCFCTLFIFHS
jgi:hypothetical protein